MLVKDLMTPNPIFTSPLRSVADAAKIMEESAVRHLPVLDENGQLLGLLTRSSLGRALPGMGTGLTRFEFNYLTSSTSVSDVMIEQPKTIAEDAGVEEAARVMNENRISSLLVMRGNELVGIITDTDLFGALLVLLGARRPGVRLTVHIQDRPGEFVRVLGAIAKRSGNITAFGGWHVKDAPGIYGAMLKIENLAQEQVMAAMEEIPEAKLVDIREATA